jgi:hypothetical protein
MCGDVEIVAGTVPDLHHDVENRPLCLIRKCRIVRNSCEQCVIAGRHDAPVGYRTSVTLQCDCTGAGPTTVTAEASSDLLAHKSNQ